jgi:hypothetical protein
MSAAKVRTALEIALHTMTPALTTAWENQDFSPVPDTPYQEVHLLPALPDNPTLGDDHYRERGILQVSLKYPVNGGAAAATARAELIRATFFRGASFTSGGVTTRIPTKPEIGRGMVVKDRWVLPVSIRYFADVFA